MPLELKIGAFSEGGAIPRRHTCDGEDLSPALSWSGAPADAKGFGLIVDDPDAPGGVWNHWLLYDVPVATQSLPEGFKPGKLGASGVNDFGKPGYGGPCPPKGHGPHRYFFKLFALNTATLGLKQGAKRAELDRALKGHIVAEAQHMGRYERK